MDYDEWTPIGRGDPLKNDPTFDYSPPMVSKVKYWINPLHRTPDPPIVLNKELSTESSQYTATIASIASKQSTEIKRYFQDPDLSYIQTTNGKFNNKLQRPQLFQYQNYYVSPTRHPPLPLPMLAPPPPIEPNSYSSIRTENSTILELSWDVRNHSTTETTTAPRLSSTVTTMFTIPATKIAFPTEKEPNWDLKIISDKSTLQNLLVKEKIGAFYSTNPTTTVAPLTPNPIASSSKLQSTSLSKPTTHLIIQGHSKVKKYGGAGKLDRWNSSTRDVDTNDILKYELPKDARVGKQLNLEDFLPINGPLRETLKDIATNQAEGSGIGAELTKMLFSSLVRPSTTLVYESPRYRHNPRTRIINDKKENVIL